VKRKLRKKANPLQKLRSEADAKARYRNSRLGILTGNLNFWMIRNQKGFDIFFIMIAVMVILVVLLSDRPQELELLR
jgi:hypothetical protein